MKFLRTLFTTEDKLESLFEQKGKTLAEYQEELLSKMAKRQFEKLDNLGLSIQINLG